jgi:hypothetical protein
MKSKTIKARARLASTRLSADTRRLNWLDEVNQRTNQRTGTVYGWRFDINHNRAALTDHNLPAVMVRQAIDEAMKVSKHQCERCGKLVLRLVRDVTPGGLVRKVCQACRKLMDDFYATNVGSNPDRKVLDKEVEKQ